MILNLIFTHIFQIGWQKTSATIVMEVLRLEIPDGWVFSWANGRESLSLPMKNCKTCVRNDEWKATWMLLLWDIFIAVVCWCVACWVFVFNYRSCVNVHFNVGLKHVDNISHFGDDIRKPTVRLGGLTSIGLSKDEPWLVLFRWTVETKYFLELNL